MGATWCRVLRSTLTRARKKRTVREGESGTEGTDMTSQRWLGQYLVDTGRMSIGGFTRKPRLMRCRLGQRCGARVLGALLDEWPHFDTQCEPAALTADGEALAILAGRRTYKLAGNRLNWRESVYQITHWPAGRTGGLAVIVLAEHICDQPIPVEWTMPPEPEPDPDAEDIPPF